MSSELLAIGTRLAFTGSEGGGSPRMALQTGSIDGTSSILDKLAKARGPENE